ncbi:uncharacterized protein LOC106773324 [Vigna radiata var. radiata]|uniref:Uncharacterized protein LOC106773324 n=1 Tax=Vigna radiata var. radiata TaxID=3916 RepID=A0A1S3VB72_VIGRR|nr:uncharacterized protein LOC106773324 [Vigna radiata var. radiata]
MPDITFTNRDFHTPEPEQDDPMVITARIAQYDVSKVLIEQGSSINILYWTTFKKMELTKDAVTPFHEQIVGFAGERVDTRGYLVLRTRLGTGDKAREIRVRFLLVEANTSFGDEVPVRKRQKRPEAILVDLDPQTNTDNRIQPQGEIKPFLLGKNAEQTTNIGADLTPVEESNLTTLLRSNGELFAWNASDMPGNHPSVITHKLSIFREARPIAQKKRRLGTEKRVVVQKEVEKLVKVGFIREITIDRLVDGASGHTVLSFLDAYSGYNQIPMYAPDQNNTAFITEQANYCYEVMSFGLKNVGATYQRLMDKIFHNQIGQCMEVYVDDMVVRSCSHQQHLKDLAEVFHQLKQYSLRLNP